MLKGRVVAVQSGSDYGDGDRRVEIQIEGAEAMFRRVRIPEKLLGLTVVKLDSEIYLDIISTDVLSIDAPLAQAIRHDQQIKHEGGGDAQ